MRPQAGRGAIRRGVETYARFGAHLLKRGAGFLKQLGPIGAGAALVLAALALWRVVLLERRVDEIANELKTKASNAPARTPAQPSPAATATGPNSDVPPSAWITYDNFARLWFAGPAARAERECWKPIETPDMKPEALLGFTLTVGPDGKVSKVMVRQDLDPKRYSNRPKKLYDCVSRVIMQMQFPKASRERVGDVQATRPEEPK